MADAGATYSKQYNIHETLIRDNWNLGKSATDENCEYTFLLVWATTIYSVLFFNAKKSWSELRFHDSRWYCKVLLEFSVCSAVFSAKICNFSVANVNFLLSWWYTIQVPKSAFVYDYAVMCSLSW